MVERAEMICDKDCFKCKHKDCIVDGITESEKQESIKRDIQAITDDSNVSYKKQYYWQHHEQCKRWSRENYHRHKEVKKEKSRQYYANNKDKFNEYSRRWREEHKELLKERQKQYYLNWKMKKEREQTNVDS